MKVDHTGFILESIEKITDEIRHLSPSEFVEEHRYLPASVTRYPGPYRFSLNPFMREIVDCFDPRSDVREVNLMKGVQITYSTVAECVLMYAAAHLKTYPCQWLTNDDGMAKKRLDNNIVPMFMQSGLGHILQSNDTTNVRKQGVTGGKVSWFGGGYCLAHGVQVGSKLRQDSIMIQLKDELDAWKDYVGKDGDPDKVSDDRCAAFWEVRKQFRGSTPLLLGSSKIYRQFMRGDQRHYYVRCLKCGHQQHMQWKGTDKETKKTFGMKWDLSEEGILLPESVRYECKNCNHPHFEHDKEVLFATESGAEWKPHAKPAEPGVRSYKLPALYSPIGMQPWSKSVSTWLDAWDTENNKPKNMSILQVFYNNVLAEPFEMTGDRVKLHMVSKHRRRAYNSGEIPNQWLETAAQATVGLVMLTVDVQGDWLAVGAWGFTRGNRLVLIEYIEILGSTEHYDRGAWAEMRELIENKIWRSDDGREYRAILTLIDSSFATSTVYQFCAQYDTGVIPIQGKDNLGKGAALKEFNAYETKLGTQAFTIKVDIYKDRMAIKLRDDWDRNSVMPEGAFSAPLDISDKVLKHLTVEYKKQKRNERTGQPMGWEWYRPGNARQELWDLMVYAEAGIEILAWNWLVVQEERDFVDWKEFWDVVMAEKLFYTEAKVQPGEPT